MADRKAANAIVTQAEKLKWQAWVNQNRDVIQQSWRMWYGRPLTEKQLYLLAGGGGEDDRTAAMGKRLYRQYYQITKWETYAPAFHEYYGRNATRGEIAREARRYSTPAEYTKWLQGGEEAKANMAEVKELWNTYSGEAPTQTNLQGYFAGRAGAGTFQQKYELFKKRKEAAFKPQTAGIAFGTNKDTGLTGSPSLQNQWEY